jgi:hypothetical protein
MKNPWTRKNPFLSMWLSGANAIAGTTRGRASAAMKRQAHTAMTEGMKQATEFWTSMWMPTVPKKRRKRR